MSLKLSELLNPAPTSPPPSPPRALVHHSPEPLQLHTVLPHTTEPYPTQSHPVQSPEFSHKPQFASQQGSHSSNYPPPPLAAIASSYEAASALTALAISGAPSPYGSYTYAQSPSQSSRDHFSPVATSYPPLYDTSRRQSLHAPVEPSPITERTSIHLSPATTLEQYHLHHTRSRSPEHQFPSRFEPGPVLAPIDHHARTTPPQGLHGSTASARDTTNILLNQQQPQIMDSSTTADANHPAQSHQFAQVRDAPTTEQIREPSLTAPTAPMDASAADAVERKAVQSPLHIKDEPSQTPREHTPAQTTSAKETTPTSKNLDSDTLKAIEAAKNDFSFRERSSKAKQSIEDSVSTTAAIPTTEAPVSKKRPAPTSSRNRKGMAVVKKPAAKKRKVDNESSAAGSNVRRSATPSSRNGTSKTPGFRGGKNSASQTPAGSSPAPDFLDDGDEEAGSDDSSGEVFCICRRGDNHTYMIACDGGCEDWFHGKCVHIREEDGDLIDKYICPSCSEKSGSVTTWLPMCRREGCRRPARLKKGSASKYCSDECGVLFMRTLVEKSAGGAGSAGAGENSKSRNRRKANRADHDGNEGDSDEDDLGPRGGALRPSELKALVVAAPDIVSFRALGEGVLSPPQTVSPTSGNFPESAKLTNGSNGESYTLNSSETQTISDFNAKKDLLRTRRALLRDREKFVGMTREQVQRYAEREGIKLKDVCGYDSRLAWPEETFDRWRKSPTGITALRLGTLDGASTQPTANGITPPKSEGEAGDEGPATTENNSDGMDFDVEKEVQMCTRKRCERHRLWQKQALSDVRFEESTLADQMRQLEREEREVREGAMLRWRKEVGGAGGVKEGWVEVVGEAMEVDA